MPEFGMRIKDKAGNTLLLTPDLHTIVSSGRVSMPVGLNGDGTYGLNIDLPGTGSYDEDDLGILATGFILAYDVQLFDLVLDGMHGISWFMHNTFTFYTRNETTGVMTVWTPDLSAPANYDAILSVYPICFWEKKNYTTFTAVTIFAAMCYEVYDQSAGQFIKVYAIGPQGIEQIDYAVYARRYHE